MAAHRKKEILFKELYLLDEPDNDSEHSPLEPFLKQAKSKHSHKNKQSTLFTVRGRTISAPDQTVTSVLAKEVNNINDTPDSTKMASSLKVQAPEAASRGLSVNKSFPVVNGSKDASRPGKKRKRNRSMDPVPDAQKIFRDFFIPNDDISPARKLRIKRATERGAVWVKQWTTDITHVIVDQHLSYKDVISFLKIPFLPSNIVLVNENYPAECMAFNALVHPDQLQYRIEGQTPLSSGYKRTSSSTGASLQLKPDRNEYAPQPPTPSRTDGSEQESLRHYVKDIDARVVEDNEPSNTPKASQSNPHDPLDSAIEEVRGVKDLPIDFDEDDVAELDHKTDSEGDLHEQSEDEKKKPKARKRSADKSWQENFNCMQKHDGLDKADNPNRQTIDILQQMLEHYERAKDHWRTTAYRKAIAQLRKLNKKIMTQEEASAVPFIGERLAEKIEEIVWTNKLRRLENAKLEPDDASLQLFTEIYGVGTVRASQWVKQGFRTLDDLREKADLHRNEKIGIDHFEDFLKRIPRAEVEKHGQVVGEVIAQADSDIEITIGGSYRRGATDSGDIDLVVTKPNCTLENLRTIIIDAVIPQLWAVGYLRASLAETAREEGSKWHGAACLQGSTVWRRVDFLLVPWNEMGAALIYFTGNDIFNRSIRLLASKKNMRLNQRGLWRDVIRGKNRERITQGSLVESESEKRIFEILGVPYRPPEHRIC